MPEMDGLETLRQLMQMDRTLNVIMLSCSNEVTTVVEAIRLGALDYLTKPFEKPELDAALLESAGRRSNCARKTRRCANTAKHLPRIFPSWPPARRC